MLSNSYPKRKIHCHSPTIYRPSKMSGCNMVLIHVRPR